MIGSTSRAWPPPPGGRSFTSGPRRLPSATRSRVVARSGHAAPHPADTTSDGAGVPRVGSDVRSGVAPARPTDLEDRRPMQGPPRHPDDARYKAKEVSGCEQRSSWHGPSTCCTPARPSPRFCLQPPPDGSPPAAGSSCGHGYREESHDAFPPYRVRADLAGRSRRLSGRGLEAGELVDRRVRHRDAALGLAGGGVFSLERNPRVQAPLKEPIPQP